MNVLIISDSHGLTTELQTIVSRHKQHVDAIIHCGDSELTSDHEALQHMLVVRGNCDHERRFPTDLVEEVNGVRFFITHGHLYNVKMTLMNLYYKAKEVGARIVCFGHSHIAGCEQIDDVLFINPGSIYLPRLRREKTYAMLHIDETNITVHFYNIDGQLLHDLTSIYKTQ
ncbi:metallophosphoesterase family protein [Anoxybacillus ayderensis]|uniref:metallophosphoesterase family protein n=1 Tax=Anoxybacillus ayderensis TaxID=265546 RepID=UPI000A26D2C1|nr:metallophosphoesterase [Anoxybacillus ayderensis]MED0656019.1 metallophosphoesterase [Anoxybacillus ayderensis]OSX54443.1 YfcE family phosphodiesterase [Anoxybacillus ayderensis]